MKAAVLIAATLTALAAPASAQTAPQLAKAEVVVTASDPVELINRAGGMVERGQYRAARELYERVVAEPADYRLETTSGTWAYPAEIARRNLREIDRRESMVALASRN